MSNALRAFDYLVERMPRWGWLILALAAAMVIISVGMRPGDQLRTVGLLPRGMDKVLHFTAYAGLAVLLFRWRYPVVVSDPVRGALPWLWTILGPAVLGLCDEIMQSRTPGRSADPLDWLADTTAGCVVLALGLTRRYRALETQRAGEARVRNA